MTDPHIGSSKNDTVTLRTRLDDLEKLLFSDAIRTEQLAAQLSEEALAAGDFYVAGMALCIQAGASFYQNSFDQTQKIYERILQSAELAHIPKVAARVLNGMGSLHQRKREYAKSIQCFYASAKKSGEIQDEMGMFRSMNSIGLTYGALGIHKRAKEIHLDLVERSKEKGIDDQYWLSLVNLMGDYLDMADYDSALSACHRYFLPYRGQREIPDHCLTLLDAHYARALAHNKCLVESYEISESVIERLRSMQDWDALCEALNERARVTQLLGNAEEAYEIFMQALELSERYECIRQGTNIRRYLSEWYRQQGLYKEANDELRKVIDMEDQLQASNRWHSIQLHELYEQLNILENEKAKHYTDALHDSLTGLPNRAHFQKTVSERLLSRPEEPLAVIFVDLDNFKHVNDNYGHAYGDELLVQVSQRMQSAVQPQDMAARLGGDEFTLLLDSIDGKDAALSCANRLLELLSQPYLIGNEELHVTASVGLAIAPKDGTDVATLQKNADEAMYAVKKAGKNRVHAFDKGVK